MSAPEIARARQEAELARERMTTTAAELQQRLKPGTIAGNAWAGVRDKSADMAGEAVGAVKARPVIVSAALAAFTLFLARAPLKSAVSRLFGSEADEDLVTTRLTAEDENYDLTAPRASRKVNEGASV